MSEFKRPVGVPSDPELCYRSGYQHGAYALLKSLEARLAEADRTRLLKWIEIDLQRWRHDRSAEPIPPRA